MSEEPEATTAVTEASPTAAQQAAPSSPVREDGMGRWRDRPRGGGITWPVLWIFAGVMLLLYTTGRSAGAAWWRITMLWPAILILIGLDICLRRTAHWIRVLVALAVLVALVGGAIYLLTLPGGEARVLNCATGEARWGRVVLDMGVGRLQVSTSDRPRADFAGGLFGDPDMEFRCANDADPVLLEIRQRQDRTAWWARGGDSFWKLDLARAVPLQALSVRMGVGESTLDLSALNLDNLHLESGVGRVHLTLPGPEGAAMTKVSLRSGVGSLEVTIPPGMAAEIRVDSGVGYVSVDQSRFPWRDGVYRSEGYHTAAYRLEIEIHAGVGAVTVK